MIALALLAAAAAAAAPPEAAGAPPAVRDLPLVEVPAAGPGTRLAILVTGDGGWAAADKALAAALAEAGVATVALESPRYLWRRRSAEEMARDVARISAHYAAAWGRGEVLLVGYSRGADLVPFLAPRLPPAERARIRLVAMLGPATFAAFEFHPLDLLANRRRPGDLGTEEAVRATAGAFRMVCAHGAKEKDSLCPRLADLPWVTQVELPGGHRLTGDQRALVRALLDAAGDGYSPSPRMR